MRVAAAQLAPIWLDKRATLVKVAEAVREAAAAKCDLVAFGEALVPGFPLWVLFTEACKWDEE